MNRAQFWDKLKQHLGPLTDLAAPLLTKVVDKVKPMIEALGQKAAPVFATYVRSLLRDACNEAEENAGLQ